MATITATRKDVGLTPQFALGVAWSAWVVLLAAPIVLLAAITPRVINQPAPRGPASVTADAWFIGVMIYLGVAVPAAFFLRGYLFRDYWIGRSVAPRAYLAGSLVVWIALEVGAVLSLVGCLLSASPAVLLPGLLAVAVFALSWPSGTAMTARGNTDDPERYTEPR